MYYLDVFFFFWIMIFQMASIQTLHPNCDLLWIYSCKIVSLKMSLCFQLYQNCTSAMSCFDLHDPISFMYFIKCKGPSTAPCGTPLLILSTSKSTFVIYIWIISIKSFNKKGIKTGRKSVIDMLGLALDFLCFLIWFQMILWSEVILKADFSTLVS